MKNMLIFLKAVVLSFALFLSILSTEMHANPNAAEFLNPPDKYKTGVWWHWILGSMDEEGIRADLDHMKNMGISYAVVFQIGSESPDIPSINNDFLSPRWQELFRYAVEQAALRNIEIGLNVCDGWTAGGPWITPEYAVSTGGHTDMSSSHGGLLLDPFNKAAMDIQWENVVELILKEAGEDWVKKYVDSTFTYTQIDSWEGSDPMKSPALSGEFLARRGYEMGSRTGQRYKDDFDLTRCEVWAANHWGYLTDLSHAINLKTHSEAAGPIFSVNDYMADRLMNIGTQDIAMGEFWTRDAGNNIRFHNDPDFGNLHDEDHMKTVSSAAHIYGIKVVQAEAFTHEYTNFTQSLWDMKDVGDRAFCQGLNRCIFHSMVAQAGNSGNATHADSLFSSGLLGPVTLGR